VVARAISAEAASSAVSGAIVDWAFARLDSEAAKASKWARL
jgi:hypothetical protein